VSIGYDIPWRKVNELLIDAAFNTPGVVDDPRPFVLETSLSDWYPVYQVNAYIKEAEERKCALYNHPKEISSLKKINSTLRKNTRHRVSLS